MSRRTDRDPRAGSVLLSLLLWVALVAAASGTGRLLEGVGWLIQLALAVGVVLAVPAGARALRAHPVVPPVLGTLTAVVVLTAMFVPARALLFLLPTPAAIADAQTLAQAGFTSIAQQGLPATADSGIAFLLVGGVVVLAWAADLFAFSVRLPALTGLFLLALLAVPAIIDPSEVSWPSLVLTAPAYAGVLAAGSRPERRAPARRLSSASALPSVAVVGVVVVAAGLLAGSASGYVRTPSSSGVSGTLFNGSIDPVVALGDDLRRPNPVTVLRYSTDSDLPVYLRVLTVSDFDGENWAPSGTEATAPVEEPIAPEGLAESVPRETEQVEVEVETLRSQWLPVPYPVSSLDASGTAGCRTSRTARSAATRPPGPATSTGSRRCDSRPIRSSCSPLPRRATPSSATWPCRPTCRRWWARPRPRSRPRRGTPTTGRARCRRSSAPPSSPTPRTPRPRRATTATAWESSRRSSRSARATACISPRRWPSWRASSGSRPAWRSATSRDPWCPPPAAT
ncbi:hypothetical protein B0T42_13170 [Rathayibacter sp. VKM Ac-2630]|nr:hypothetical protein B0T42_13170 [Rathayibacter sp. VKM Ac-2630]